MDIVLHRGSEAPLPVPLEGVMPPGETDRRKRTRLPVWALSEPGTQLTITGIDSSQTASVRASLYRAGRAMGLRIATSYHADEHKLDITATTGAPRAIAQNELTCPCCGARLSVEQLTLVKEDEDDTATVSETGN